MTEERKNKVAAKIVEIMGCGLLEDAPAQDKAIMASNARRLIELLNFEFNKQPLGITDDEDDEPVDFQVMLLSGGASLPERKTDGAAGFDIRADFTNGISKSNFVIMEDPPVLEHACILIPPFAQAVIPCGFAMSIPEGYEAQVRPRSGLAVKGLTVTNAPGTIDSDFRGEVKVIMNAINTQNVIKITHGDRIAQLVIQKLPNVKIRQVESLDSTDRGEGGFGHTGVK